MNRTKVFRTKEDLESALSDNPIRVLRIGEQKVCIAKHDDTFFAFQHLCPHQKHPLKEGLITDFGEIVCPLHEYRFNLKSGICVNQKCSDLITYQIEIESQGAFINLK